MSVIVIHKLKCRIDFGERTTIFLPSGDVLYYWNDIEETPITEEFMPEIATFNNGTALIAQPSPGKNPAKIWHERLNHIPNKRLKDLQQVVTGFDIVFDNDDDTEICEGCVLGKYTRARVAHKPSRTIYQPLQLLVADVAGPYDSSRDRMKGALLITDAATNFIWTFTIKSKSEVASIVRNHIESLERKFPNSVKVSQSDMGTEFLSRKVQTFLDSKGVEFRSSVPYVKEYNERAKNSNRIIIYVTRALLYGSSLKRAYWTYAMRYATYIHNRLVPSRGGKTPFEKLFGSVPDLSALRIFGCSGYSQIDRNNRQKWDPTARKATFPGITEK